MSRTLGTFFYLLCSLIAVPYASSPINPSLLNSRWPASWITHPDAAA